MKKPVDLTRVANESIDVGKQFIGNATIDLPEYSSPEFRARQLRQAIEALQRAERALLTQHLIETSAKV